LIQWNGAGYSLEQTANVYDTIEGLITSLDLRLENVKKNRVCVLSLGFDIVHSARVVSRDRRTYWVNR
jgi:hypothetical protein